MSSSSASGTALAAGTENSGRIVTGNGGFAAPSTGTTVAARAPLSLNEVVCTADRGLRAHTVRARAGSRPAKARTCDSVFKLTPCDASTFENAPIIYRDAMEIARPASDVWRELVADGSLDWCRALAGARWTSPKPYGIGTTRTMRVAGALVIDERYLHWEEGRRKSFYVVEANLPLFEYFGEDYLVEETGSGSSRFTWTMAGKATPIGAAGAPVLSMLVNSMFADTRKHFGATH